MSFYFNFLLLSLGLLFLLPDGTTFLRTYNYRSHLTTFSRHSCLGHSDQRSSDIRPFLNPTFLAFFGLLFVLPFLTLLLTMTQSTPFPREFSTQTGLSTFHMLVHPNSWSWHQQCCLLLVDESLSVSLVVSSLL